MPETNAMLTGDGVTWKKVIIEDGKTTTLMSQDVEPLIESNKREYNGDGPRALLGRKVASIPRNEIYNLCHRIGITPHFYMQLPWEEQRKILARHIINNREYQYFRTSEGQWGS